MIRAALRINHLCDLPRLGDVQKSTRPGKFSCLLLLFSCSSLLHYWLLDLLYYFDLKKILPPMLFFSRMGTPFRILFYLDAYYYYFFKSNFSNSFYDSSPPTANQLSLLSGRVPRHLSGCVSNPSSTAAQISVCTCALGAYISSHALSLSLTRARTHTVHTRRLTALTSATLLRKGGMRPRLKPLSPINRVN